MIDPRLGNAGGLGHHSDLHDLTLDLPKPCHESPPSRALRNQNAGRPYHWIDDITRPQSELLDPSVDTGANKGLVQIDLRFGQCRLCACLFRRQQSAQSRHRGLFGRGRGVEGALATRNGYTELFDVALRHDSGVALLQFAFCVEFVLRLLQRALCFLKLAFRLHDIGLRGLHGGIDFGDLAPGCQ